ncbi:dienelactone hydrolase family protein [Nonomuraea lactucae]|uniref:dienelactone hydrolase family protein n=1 Tax=Nonomuraea lactucae TaxID=2249762 RepID=UPI000DE49D92|nr:dienelactone hydrolase family protein [Nonomuraea lactucae]
MAEVVLFHHCQGLTSGVNGFADRLRAAGHTVFVPDLYEGATFATLEEGVAHAEKIGYEAIIERGVAAVAGLPGGVVYAGFSLGALPAQKLAQTRPGALAALLYHGGIPASTFGGPWPEGVALQIHVNDRDEWSELDVVRKLVDASADAELFTYAGSAHLFTDDSLDEYDADSTELVLERSVDLLDRWS